MTFVLIAIGFVLVMLAIGAVLYGTALAIRWICEELFDGNEFDLIKFWKSDRF